ncbi:molybdopterin-binding protein, partial [Cutibacterium acnes subsp. acnes]|nr:molybdopterin-binding protein [Cutibacterium acnes subsp. acnes]
VVPDGIDSVGGALRDALENGCRLVVTTGGTGISPRDLTPEATEPLLVARLDGLAEQVRALGAHGSALAGLSRGLVGVTSRGDQ